MTAFRYGGPDGCGRYGMLDTVAGRLLCHDCGGRYLHLATHARRSHALSAAEYRERHGLGYDTVLVAEAARKKMAAVWERHRDEHLERLQSTRDPGAARQAAHDRRAGREWRPEVVARRQQAGRSRAGRDLTSAETEFLGDETDIRGWADRARTLLAMDGVTRGSLARVTGIARPTIDQRLRRYPG